VIHAGPAREIPPEARDAADPTLAPIPRREAAMADHDIVVVGASAGGVEALVRVVEALPSDLPAGVFVVLHLPATATSALPGILNRHGPLPASHAKDGEPVEPGRIYVAPPDRHLLLKQDQVHLGRGPRENGHRPAIDPLFRSAARRYGARVTAVVLSGALDDGTAGLVAVRRFGGVAIVQDPDDALYQGMPSSAIEHGGVDHVLPAPAIGARIAALARGPGAEQPSSNPDVPDVVKVEDEMTDLSMSAIKGDNPGRPSAFSCPDCNGVLWELHDGDLIRFRCRVGHAWSPESLLSEQREQLEAALWIALRSLEERASLARRLGGPARQRGHRITAARFEEQARESDQAAELVRRLLVERDSLGEAWPLGDLPRRTPPSRESE
jgi:two-component system, chemotaxis family, protein-glutamate methylesterase/glutaminase